MQRPILKPRAAAVTWVLWGCAWAGVLGQSTLVLAQNATPTWTPATADPKDLEGVWLPGGFPRAPAANTADASGSPNGPPPEFGDTSAPPGGGAPGGPPGGPPNGAPGGPPGGPPGGGQGGPPPGGAPGAGADQVSGSTLECTPVQRLGGAGGGMSNLWIEGPKEIVMISEEDMDIRKIYLVDQHPAHLKPQPNGHAIGHWEGNVLVVDSVGFSGPDGKDSGEHVVERIHKDKNMLIDDLTITRNGKTTQQTNRSSWRSDLHVYENVCEENFSRFHFENGQLVDQTQ